MGKITLVRSPSLSAARVDDNFVILSLETGSYHLVSQRVRDFLFCLPEANKKEPKIENSTEMLYNNLSITYGISSEEIELLRKSELVCLCETDDCDALELRTKDCHVGPFSIERWGSLERDTMALIGIT